MSEPEIAHRCPSCGASIRVRGLFCPQCGKPTSGKNSDSDPQGNSAETETVSVDLAKEETTDLANGEQAINQSTTTTPAETVSVDLTEGATTELASTQPAIVQSTTATPAEVVPLENLKTRGEISGVRPGKKRVRAGVPTKSSLRHKSGTGVRGAVGRARTARDVIEEDVLQGVVKLREISTVVLDGASYDPSLRFLLVAAVLFLMFLLILFLSEVMN